jgi:hypothetical protein
MCKTLISLVSVLALTFPASAQPLRYQIWTLGAAPLPYPSGANRGQTSQALIIDKAEGKAWICNAYFNMIDVNGNPVKYVGTCTIQPTAGGPFQSPGLPPNQNLQAFTLFPPGDAQNFWFIDEIAGNNQNIHFCNFQLRVGNLPGDLCWDFNPLP